MSSITDRVIALALKNLDDSDEPVMVPLADVLDIVENAIPVEVDMEMYSEAMESADDEQKEALTVISTVYNLLAETAVKFATRQVRATLEEVGIELVSDEQLFASRADDPTAIRSYRDLTPRNVDRVEELADTFQRLVDETQRAAAMGLIASLTARSERGE
jgi:hypothetical protein